MQAHVRNVMTANPTLVSLQTPLAQAAQFMRDRDTGDVLVADGNGALYGIVTDRDIVTRAVADGLDPTVTPVQAVITPTPVWVHPDDDADRAVTLMRQYAIRRLPVVDRDGTSVLADISAALPNS
jgi:CBS domain-containing protein